MRVSLSCKIPLPPPPLPLLPSSVNIHIHLFFLRHPPLRRVPSPVWFIVAAVSISTSHQPFGRTFTMFERFETVFVFVKTTHTHARNAQRVNQNKLTLDTALTPSIVNAVCMILPCCTCRAVLVACVYNTTGSIVGATLRLADRPGTTAGGDRARVSGGLVDGDDRHGHAHGGRVLGKGRTLRLFDGRGRRFLRGDAVQDHSGCRV